MVKTAPDYNGIPKRVLRSDLYLEAMKELGVTTKIAEEQKITLFDGVFDGTNPEKYATSFKVHSMAATSMQALRRSAVLHFLCCRHWWAIGLALLVWWGASLKVTDLPSPARTWEESKLYMLEPFAKRGEVDQGIALLAYYSLVRVGAGLPPGRRRSARRSAFCSASRRC